MSDGKNVKTEWSFSFEKLGQDIGDFVKSLGASAEETVKQSEFNAPLAGATDASIRLDFSVGETTVKALTNLDNLIEADVTYVGDLNFVVTGETSKVVALSQKSQPADWIRNVVGWIGSQGKLRWDVGLATSVPIALEVHGGAGKSNLDLRELQLTSVHISSGAGEVDLILPAQSSKLVASVNGGVGETDVIIPDGSDVDLTLRGGAGEVDLSVGAGVNLNANISGGVGETKIVLAAGTPARFEADTGIGAIRMPNGFAKLSGSQEFISNSGVWETPDYATAERKVTVRYKGGVGELKVIYTA